VTDQQQATEAVETPTRPVPVPISEQAIEAWNGMIQGVPDAGEGYGRIAAQLAAADSPEALNEPWDAEAQDMEKYVGSVLIVRSVSKAQSDYAGGLPWFLIVDAIDESTGEAVILITGSANIVMQLTKAYVMGWLPRRVMVEVSAKATKNGYYPQRLQFLPDQGAASNGNGAA
jgi:hypothetical protein